MKILIIEDDSYKYTKIAALLKNRFMEASLLHEDSVHDAVIYIRGHTPDLLILDMSLPSHSLQAGQGNPVSMPAGGVEIIMELKILGKINIPIIVVTQYPDVEIEDEYYSIEESRGVISRLYNIKNTSVIYYDNDSSEWIEKFNESLETI